MPKQVVINKVEDLSKLRSWVIDDVRFVGGVDSAIEFKLHQQLAERPIKLTISSGVIFGRSGNVVIANGNLAIRAEDIEDTNPEITA